MKDQSKTPAEYLKNIPADRKKAFTELRNVIKKNLPKGFTENIAYGMLSFSVPLSKYPDGYHCQKDTPLMMISLASQKNFIAMYHMGMYADPKLLKWFQDEYKKHSKAKLDMGKSCVRLKKMDDIPFKLFAELAKKITVDQWIEKYESAFKKGKK
jgi:uncharacterized protein YdhG (YjbR/CyaY superfamily)